LKKEKLKRKEIAKKQLADQKEIRDSFKNCKTMAEYSERMKAFNNTRTAQMNMNNAMNELFEQESFKFGDACIAAPFTSKYSSSIKCVLIILKQGICTLVTSIQTYKILTLSSLLSAYSMSALHLEALKFSETQMTILGVTAAANYYYFSNTKPVKQLPRERPPRTIFDLYFVTSVVGQLGLHFYGMEVAAKRIAHKYAPVQLTEEKVTNDEAFVPTFFNTVVFLFSLVS